MPIPSRQRQRLARGFAATALDYGERNYPRSTRAAKVAAFLGGQFAYGFLPDNYRMHDHYQEWKKGRAPDRRPQPDPIPPKRLKAGSYTRPEDRPVPPPKNFIDKVKEYKSTFQQTKTTPTRTKAVQASAEPTPQAPPSTNAVMLSGMAGGLGRRRKLGVMRRKRSRRRTRPTRKPLAPWYSKPPKR